jgi:hypothetical protein
MEVLLPKDVEACSFGSNPEISFRILKDREDDIVADGWLELGMAIAFVQRE